MASVTTVNLLTLATSLPYANYLSTLSTNTTTPTFSFLAYNSTFSTSILAPNATARLLHSFPDWEPFHEAGVYDRGTNSMYITSNYNIPTGLSNPINMTIVSLDDWSIRSTRYPGIHEPNGGTSYYPPGSNPNTTDPLLLFCDEGDFTHASALTTLDPSTNTTTVILNNYLGRNFSSINDVRQHPETGDLWFTDADYGYFQYFRPTPTIPKHVYRFSPSTGVIQVVADGFVQPNGLEFSPDFKTLYVSDTGAVGFERNFTRPATVYAFDVVDERILRNRRVFAYPDSGFPDGVHTDTAGNVWAGVGDGVHIWNEEGILLGKLHIGKTSNNFAFIPGGVMVFSNADLWLVEGLAVNGREVCLDFGVCD
ncbi:hypothetical protein H2199_007216 [Coniosporium tulheliwenetii]|uniref:Uncharacterized protein n=1 Tax=Coniosporium tulheliwenetii TaxID=3383036 RepID=A0ACC2YQQ2_9PEZI|nr:hypothetical protein H2199_007216 [Cladosporium sp. JES 115]